VYAKLFVAVKVADIEAGETFRMWISNGAIVSYDCGHFYRAMLCIAVKLW